MRADERQIKARKQLLRKTALRSRCPSGRKRYPTLAKAEETLARIAALTGREPNAQAKACWLCAGFHIRSSPVFSDKLRKPLSVVSNKRAKENRERTKVLRDTFGESPLCARCGKPADDAHELLSRARGGSIVDPANIKPLCRACHDWVTTHPAQAETEGFSQSSADYRAQTSWENTR